MARASSLLALGLQTRRDPELLRDAQAAFEAWRHGKTLAEPFATNTEIEDTHKS